MVGREDKGAIVCGEDAGAGDTGTPAEATATGAAGAEFAGAELLAVATGDSAGGVAGRTAVGGSG